jgi:putative ATP-dependent endonuclease of OLD family
LRVKSIEIENFRSIRSLSCDFDEVTSLIGPNGAGKSNVLRALDWFFNGDKTALGPSDVHLGATESQRIRVCVTFDALTHEDRAALGPRYCPDARTTTFTAWRTWMDGIDKITGRAYAYPAFEEVRRGGSASEKRGAYTELRSLSPELSLPPWSSASAAEEVMDAWERANPSRLSEAEVSDTHFFGIHGQGKLSQVFDFVFVSADLRAPEETSASRDSLLSRILQRAVVREDFDEASAALVEDFATQYAELGEKHLRHQLDDLATELTDEVANYAPGRRIVLKSSPGVIKPVQATVDVRVADVASETPVGNQGHGFQRTLLLAALTVLSRRRRSDLPSGQMFLAIEEPELFQHPTQARAFASVLRSLATDTRQRTQVAYATHSPYFVSPQFFDEVRRVSTARTDDSPHSFSRITRASVADVQARLKGFMPPATISRRMEQVCLKSLPEALFAESVILVEGDDDAAILEGMGSRLNNLAIDGVCVASVGGKGNMFIPSAILELLGIPILMVVDNDSGCGDRMQRNRRTPEDIKRAVDEHVRANRKLCRYVGADEEDYPAGAVSDRLAFVPDTLETLLASDLPGWDVARQKAIDEGRGVEGKNAATYALAARECADAPGEGLRLILEFCSHRAA